MLLKTDTYSTKIRSSYILAGYHPPLFKNYQRLKDTGRYPSSFVDWHKCFK